MRSKRSNLAREPRCGRAALVLALLAAALVLAALLGLCAGSYETPVGELVRGVFGRAADERVNIVVRNNRLPRILTAILAGAGLGVSGCVLQAILRNPLASASTLGVSQGASFGAAFAIIAVGLGGAGVPLFAFAGSMAVALVILGLSRLRQVSPEAIVLSGVAISSMFTGATTLLQYFADDVELQSLMFWTFGSLGSTNWADVRVLAAVTALSLAYFFVHRWDYNALLGGAETAASVGLNVRRLTLVNMVLCCFVASTVVSYIGLISFIGLIAPHMVRQAVGSNHAWLIPGAALAGAALLLLGDLFARTIVSPAVLPIGAITSFLGGPLFLYLLFRGRKR